MTEQQFLGHVMAQALAPHISVPGGLQVGFDGHESNHEALLRGDVHLYADYTGTALRRYLSLDPVPRRQVYPVVRQAARERWNVAWLEPFGFDNSYGVIMRADHATSLRLRRISDLVGSANDLTLLGTPQFLSDDPPMTFAPGGYPGLSATYGLRFGKTRAVTPNYGESFGALAGGEGDVLADFVVNPHIVEYDLVVLEDDLEFFAAYHAAPVLRGDFLEEYPQAQPVLERLAGRIDSPTMARLNHAMEFELRDPADLAAEFLSSEK